MKWITVPGLDYWAKPLADGRWAIALLNRGDTPRTARLDWATADLSDGLKNRQADFKKTRFRLTDVWTWQAAGTTATPLERTIGPHDTLVFTLDPA
jgi:alpha-galactosidase